jgi:hypothetical protein
MNWMSESDSEVSASLGAYKVEDIPSEEEPEKLKKRSSCMPHLLLLFLFLLHLLLCAVN